MLTNAKDLPLQPALLGMASALFGLFQPVKYFLVTTRIVNFEPSEVLTPYQFQGVIQPMKAQAISLKPEGARAWAWFTLHAMIGLQLKVNDIIWVKNTKYRVEERFDWQDYGYIEYHVVADYQDRSTSPPIPDQNLEKYLANLVFTSPLTRTIDVSASITDARKAVWKLYDSSLEPQLGAITVLDATHVTVVVAAAGTYRLIGEA